MKVVAITTEDNPYDPLDQFDLWYGFDEMHGYHTSEYVARLTANSPFDSPIEEHEELERVIDEIVKLNVTGNYKKIVREEAE